MKTITDYAIMILDVYADNLEYISGCIRYLSFNAPYIKEAQNACIMCGLAYDMLLKGEY